MQKEKPLPDGSNLLDVNLRVSWVVHRAFLRALHYRSLRVGREDMGIAQLGMITQLATLLHCVEVEHVKWTERNVPEHFKGLETTFETVRDKLQGIADEVFTERREMVGGVAWTVDETIRNNVNDAEGFAKTIYEVSCIPRSQSIHQLALIFPTTDSNRTSTSAPPITNGTSGPISTT